NLGDRPGQVRGSDGYSFSDGARQPRTGDRPCRVTGMKRHELIDRLTKLASAASANARRCEEELTRLHGPARAGDLIIIPTGAAVIHWLIVKPHPEAPQLLFAVPADDNPETGPGDVHVPKEHSWGPVTLRCSFGLWLESDLFDSPERAGIMGEEVLGQVRAVL